MDIPYQFNRWIRKMIRSFPILKEKMTDVLKNPIQSKILKQTVAIGLLVNGIIFLGCYMASVSRTHSLNIIHAFAFRYWIVYFIGWGLTYGAYRIIDYIFNDVVDGDKLTPNGEKGASEWMSQDIDTFKSYNFVVSSKANIDWNGEQEQEQIITLQPTGPCSHETNDLSQPLSINEERIKRIQQQRLRRK